MTSEGRDIGTPEVVLIRPIKDPIRSSHPGRLPMKLMLAKTRVDAYFYSSDFICDNLSSARDKGLVGKIHNMYLQHVRKGIIHTSHTIIQIISLWFGVLGYLCVSAVYEVCIIIYSARIVPANLLTSNLDNLRQLY